MNSNLWLLTPICILYVISLLQCLIARSQQARSQQERIDILANRIMTLEAAIDASTTTNWVRELHAEGEEPIGLVGPNFERQIRHIKTVSEYEIEEDNEGGNTIKTTGFK